MTTQPAPDDPYTAMAKVIATTITQALAPLVMASFNASEFLIDQEVKRLEAAGGNAVALARGTALREEIRRVQAELDRQIAEQAKQVQQ